MTWAIDHDIGPLTLWSCSLCGYGADEDEARESDCPACGTAKSYLLLKDPTMAFAHPALLPFGGVTGR